MNDQDTINATVKAMGEQVWKEIPADGMPCSKCQEQMSKRTAYENWQKHGRFTCKNCELFLNAAEKGWRK